MRVELHLLQNVAPSCLNRDDTNTPKDCEFGGYRRARISSQAIKRPIRLSPVFTEAFRGNKGIRTKRLVERLTENLIQREKNAGEAQIIAMGFVEVALSKGDIDTDGVHKTAVLLYVGEDEITRMSTFVLDRYADLLPFAQEYTASLEKLDPNKQKKEQKESKTKYINAVKPVVQEFKTTTKAVDIALFGRMMADHPDYTVDAACQVAHAISTNKLSMETDFYTAVDDLSPEEETGAGMMGHPEFNSSCFYRYANLDFDQLLSEKNLNGDTDLAYKVVKAFLRASVTALPTGKQNSMAAHNPPEAIFAVVRQSGTPVSLANAFCKPVRPGYDSDLMAASIKEMDAYWGKLTKVYGSDGVAAKAICTIPDAKLESLADAKKDSFKDVVEAVMKALKGASNGEAK